MSIPSYTLNSGHKIPAIGFGTMFIPNDKLLDALKYALDAGYRMFDCAETYGNELQVGNAFKVIFEEGKYKREELFFTGKVYNNNHKADDLAAAFRNTLKNLQLSYLDLYLVHWPIAVAGDPKARNEKGKIILEKTPLSVTWKAMEQLVKEGLTKSIGVANFPVVILNDLLSYCEIVPATNQIEIHPFNQRTNLIGYCHDNNIHCTAYFPSCRNGNPKVGSGINPRPFPSILTNPVLVELAKRYNKTPSQICLRWGIQRKIKEGGKYIDDHYKVSVIPRSTDPAHIRENVSIVDFALTDEELEKISELEQGYYVNYSWIFF